MFRSEAQEALFLKDLAFWGGIWDQLLIVQLRRRLIMRLASLALIGLVMANTPVLAKPAADSASSKAACIAKLDNAVGASGYKLVRTCGRSAASKSGGALAIARQPVVDGSNGGGRADDVLLPVIAVATLFGGALLAIIGNGGGSGDDDGGIDPASP